MPFWLIIVIIVSFLIFGIFFVIMKAVHIKTPYDKQIDDEEQERLVAEIRKQQMKKIQKGGNKVD